MLAGVSDIGVNMTEIKTIKEFYKAINEKDERAIALISLQNQYNHLFNFDPISFKNLDSDLDTIIDRNILFHQRNSNSDNTEIQDHLYRIFLFVEPALKHIFNVMHQRILREHSMLHVGKVREIDGKSISWLNKRPGRTVKEKVSVTGRILAPRRIISIDTAENRLLKAFVYKLDRLLIAQQKATNTYAQKTKFIHRWLQSEDAEYIGKWNNTPPNNALLSDKNYKRIWKGWIELQHIDRIIKHDFENIEEIKKTIEYVDFITHRYQSEKFKIIQRPLLGDKEFNFVTPFQDHNLNLDAGITKYKKEINQEVKNKSIKADLCAIDFDSIKPNISLVSDNKVEDSKIQKLPFILLQQIWKWKDKKKKNEKTQYIDCSNSQGIILNDSENNFQIENFSIHDALNVNNENNKKHITEITEITGILIKKLSSYLNCSKLIYFLPSTLDDFSSETIRTNINLYFFNADQLPKSIAQVIFEFDQISATEIDDKKYYIVKEETVRKLIYTPIKAIKDKKNIIALKQTLEGHNGVIWERHPSIIIDKENSKENNIQHESTVLKDFLKSIPDADHKFLPGIKENSSDMFIHKIESKNNIKKINKDFLVLPKELKKYPFEKIIEINKNDIIKGGVLFGQYQRKLEESRCDVPLWKDHLPPLKLKIFDSEIQLVANKTSIFPKRGLARLIKIDTHFTLPQKSPFIEFELERGDGTHEDKFFAYIKNQHFPLKEDISCKLKLTYTYGDSSPYKLTFIPNNPQQEKKYGVFNVEWTKESHIDLSSLPKPNYPPVYKWEDFFDYPDADKPENKNVAKWLFTEFRKINMIATYGWKRYQISGISRDGKTKFVDNPPIIIFKHSTATRNRINRGNYIKCFLGAITKRGDKYIAFDAVLENENLQKCFLSNSIRFPEFTVFNNAFDILTDVVHPDDRKVFEKTVNNAEGIIKDPQIPEIMKYEMRLFLSVLHKNTPESNQYFLQDACENNFIEYYRCIAFSLGDLSRGWQKDLLNYVKNMYLFGDDPQHIDYSLRLLSIAVWRHENFIFSINFTDEELEELISILINRLKVNILSIYTETEKEARLHLSFFTELLIAILRLRKEKMYLKKLDPYSIQIKKLYKVLMELSKYKIETRMKFESKDGKKVDTMEYLMERLVGNIKNSSIKIIGVSEN